MSYPLTCYNLHYFKVYRFAVQFPSDKMLDVHTPCALFSHYTDAEKWADNNLDGLNYNVIVQCGKLVYANKYKSK